MRDEERMTMRRGGRETKKGCRSHVEGYILKPSGITVTEIAEEIEQIAAAIDHAPPKLLSPMKNRLIEIRSVIISVQDIPENQQFLIVLGEARNAIQAAIKKANRRKREHEESSKPVKVHNFIVGTEIAARDSQSVLDFEEPPIYVPVNNGSGVALAAADLVQKSMAALSTSEAGYIQDAVFNYARRFSEGEPVPMTLEGDYYVLSVTFNDFCKAGGIEGRDRAAVKKALEDNLLDQIGFLAQKDGRKYLVEKRYISRRTTIKRDRLQSMNLPNLTKADSPDELAALVLDIDAELFKFIQARGRGKAGSCPGLLPGRAKEAGTKI